MARLDCHIYGVPPSEEGHAHPYAHILLPLEAGLEVTLDGERHLLTPRHLGFIAPGRYHHCVCPTEILMINIPASMILEVDLEALSSRVAIPVTGDLVPLVELIKTEVARGPDSDSIRYLYYYLYEKLVAAGSIKSTRYIREHFSEEISIPHLARMENYNVSYFSDWFRKQTGYSPAAYIRRVRMEKAKQLLVTTQFRLIDIALQVGYQTGASFSRAFKELEGITPDQYRRSSQEEEKKNSPIPRKKEEA